LTALNEASDASASLAVYSGASRSICRSGGWARSWASGSVGQTVGGLPGTGSTVVATCSVSSSPGRCALRVARGGEVDGGLVLVGLLLVVGGDGVGVTLLPARLALGELLVELARVEEDEAGQLDRPGGGVDGASVAVLDEEREEAAMVEMGVGQQDGVELLRVVRERDPVADRFVGAALEHPAVDEDLRPFGHGAGVVSR